MLRVWLMIVGLTTLALVAASCAETGSAVEAAAAAKASAAAAQTAAKAAEASAVATTQAATAAAEELAKNADTVASAVASGEVAMLPLLPDDGQTVVVNMPTFTYVRIHGQQYVIPKPKPPADTAAK